MAGVWNMEEEPQDSVFAHLEHVLDHLLLILRIVIWYFS